MSSLSEFLTMGGYAAYVWPAYGIALVVLVVNFVVPIVARRRLLRRLARRPRPGPGRAAGQTDSMARAPEEQS